MTSTGRPVIIAGNWKMHKTRSEARELAQAIVAAVKNSADLPKVVIFPTFTSLDAVRTVIAGSPLELGAQNMDYRDSGAFTGEISPLMLIDAGVRYVLLGHSERRQLFGETNGGVNLKLKSAVKHKLVPIVCVGETVDEREAGLTDSVVSRQVVASLVDLEPAALSSLIVAYEPVWAIGTGKVCEAEEANRVAHIIRGTLSNLFKKKDFAESVPVLYGGSVKPSNIEEQLSQPEIDGVLVGGASLKAEEFLPLVEAGVKQVKLAPTAS